LNWACTPSPDLPAMIIVQHCSHSKQIPSSRNICNIFRVYRFSDCILLIFKSFKPLYAPKEFLICKSLNLTFLCCYFKRMLIINQPMNSFICHKLFKWSTVQSEAGTIHVTWTKIMHQTHRRSLARFVESNGCTQASISSKGKLWHWLRPVY
jgi:hypothetical protein